MENLNQREREAYYQYLVKFMTDYFLKFFILICIIDLNKSIFIVILVINIVGVCSYVRINLSMIHFYLFLLMSEIIGISILIYLSYLSTQYYILDEKMYFVWVCSVLYNFYNVYLIVRVFKFRKFIIEKNYVRNEEN